MNEFEKKLQQQPLRKVPAAWRQTILTAAIQAQPDRKPTWFSQLSLKALLWPNPQAWGALAAVWVLVFTLNLDSRDTTRPLVAKADATTPEVKKVLKEQNLLMAELIGPRELPVADRPKHTFKPQPRTERRIEQVIV